MTHAELDSLFSWLVIENDLTDQDILTLCSNAILKVSHRKDDNRSEQHLRLMRIVRESIHCFKDQLRGENVR